MREPPTVSCSDWRCPCHDELIVVKQVEANLRAEVLRREECAVELRAERDRYKKALEEIINVGETRDVRIAQDALKS